MFNVEIGYSRETAALLVSLVGLQQTWGVDFDTAVQRADATVKGFLRQHQGKTVAFGTEDIVALMKAVAPPAPRRGSRGPRR